MGRQVLTCYGGVAVEQAEGELGASAVKQVATLGSCPSCAAPQPAGISTHLSPCCLLAVGTADQWGWCGVKLIPSSCCSNKNTLLFLI